MYACAIPAARTREAHARGWSLVWSAQAQVDEPVAPERLALNWVFKRNYRIGNGLCLCTRLQHGWGRALLWHSLRATGQLALAGKALLGSPITGRAGLVRAACRVARACGELTGLAGHCYEEYAPRPA